MRALLLTVFILLCIIVSAVLFGSYFLGWFFDGRLPYSTQPIPKEQDVRTEWDFFEEKRVWHERLTVEAYQEKHPGDTRGADFLARVSKVCAYPTPTEGFVRVAKQGSQLISAGNHDPLIQVMYGIVSFYSNDLDGAEPYLRRAFEWDSTGYPRIHAFTALYALADMMSSKDKISRPEINHLRQKALNYFSLSLMAREFGQAESHIAYRILLHSERKREKTNVYQSVYDMIRYDESIDAWLKSIIHGCSEINSAWKDRGSGWASEVTEEGWRGFRKHLKKARTILRNNWRQYPHRPEAAAAMIAVAMAGQGSFFDTERRWFDRSVASQMDYPDAYLKMLNALRPRWGGSHGAMASFGQECLDTGRFDTDVPMFYLHALRTIGLDLERDGWRLPFRNVRIQKNLAVLFEGMLSEPDRESDRNRIVTLQALVAAWSGNYQQAADLLAKLPRIDLVNGFWGRHLSYSGREWSVIEAELAVFTGPSAKRLRQAEDLAQAGHTRQATNIFRAEMDQYRADTRIFEYLRERTALLRIPVATGRQIAPAICMAIKQGDIDTFRFLIDNGADVNSKTRSQNTPLHFAARSNDFRFVVALIRAGADVNAENDVSWTPLHYALYYERMDVALLLLQKGARTDILTDEHCSPLHYAAAKGNPELTGLLIDSGCDVNAITAYGSTPLLFALQYHKPSNARVLIEKGADINAATPDGWTAIHFAAYHGYSDVTELLLAKGADPHQPLPDGDTPLQLAHHRKNNKVVELLERH